MSRSYTPSDSCARCGEPLALRTHPATWKPRRDQPFYYSQWYRCVTCRRNYVNESDKVTLQAQDADVYRGHDELRIIEREIKERRNRQRREMD